MRIQRGETFTDIRRARCFEHVNTMKRTILTAAEELAGYDQLPGDKYGFGKDLNDAQGIVLTTKVRLKNIASWGTGSGQVTFTPAPSAPARSGSRWAFWKRSPKPPPMDEKRFQLFDFTQDNNLPPGNEHYSTTHYKMERDDKGVSYSVIAATSHYEKSKGAKDKVVTKWREDLCGNMEIESCGYLEVPADDSKAQV